LLYFFIKVEFFTYTHWPVRFNRKNRMVYVFKHNGPGGVLRVPFDEVYFHLGKSPGTSNNDLRGEVLDGDIVVDTFAAGTAVGDKWMMANIWEFVLRYMEWGPESLDFKHISLSTKRSWYNAFVQTAG